MKLTELDPRWLMIGRDRVGLVFKCPHCQQCYLSCFFHPLPVVARDGVTSQDTVIRAVLTDDQARETPHCAKGALWRATPPAHLATFENLSVTPSIDASKSGHWHGFITDGSAA